MARGWKQLEPELAKTNRYVNVCYLYWCWRTWISHYNSMFVPNLLLVVNFRILTSRKCHSSFYSPWRDMLHTEFTRRVTKCMNEFLCRCTLPRWSMKVEIFVFEFFIYFSSKSCFKYINPRRDLHNQNRRPNPDRNEFVGQLAFGHHSFCNENRLCIKFQLEIIFKWNCGSHLSYGNFSAFLATNSSSSKLILNVAKLSGSTDGSVCVFLTSAGLRSFTDTS